MGDEAPSQDESTEWETDLDFTQAAARQFLALPQRVRLRFFDTFERFARHPTRWTPETDVAPLRGSKGRWRIKVRGGYRGIYVIRHGRPLFEAFQSRATAYLWLKRYLASTKK